MAEGEDKVAIVARAIEHLGVAGGALVLWTVIFCVAIFKGDCDLTKTGDGGLWWVLYGTWCSLAALWLITVLIVGWVRSRKETQTRSDGMPGRQPRVVRPPDAGASAVASGPPGQPPAP